MTILEDTYVYTPTRSWGVSGLLDRISVRMFATNDLARELEGFEVSEPSRWTRKYRHPQMATALNARAVWNQRRGGEWS